MEVKRLSFIFAFLLILINLQITMGATSYTINTIYNFSNISFIDGTVYKTDSIVLRITTPIETECFYGTSLYPSTSFEGEYGLTHEAYLENLGEGLHKYYVRCGETSNPVMEVDFATSIPIYATIKISEIPPLKAGKYKIELVTSKISMDIPTLEYSFDDLVYKPISLKGSGENWEGNLIVPDSIGDAVCSFIFKAKDLSGEEGTNIVGDNSFIIDTSKPSTISIINAVGYEGQIKLTWFLDENVNEFNIYRSEDPQVDYTEFYKTSNKESFYDNDVEKGKTYYYRVAGVDEAGNVGDLSKEVYATALLSNYSSQSGLSPSLVGKVDNSIAEIDSVIQNIKDINETINLKDEKEKTLFKDLGLDKDLDGAISQLNSLERDIEGYKLQDLSESELDNKLASSTLKLNIIKKSVPEDITITNEKEAVRVFSEENLQKAFLEYFPNSDNSYNKEISDTLKIIKDKNINITGNFYGLDIMYMDGTKKQITLVEEAINPKLDNLPDFYFVLIVPKEIAAQSSELKFINLDYQIIKDDPVISFNSNTQKIIYYLSKEMSLDSLDGILITPMELPASNTSESKITGNSILNSASSGSWGIIALAIFAFILGIYFLRIKSESSIKPVLKIMEDLKKVKELIKNGKEEEGKELYELVKEEYKVLSEKEKEFVIENMKKMNEDIIK